MKTLSRQLRLPQASDVVSDQAGFDLGAAGACKALLRVFAMILEHPIVENGAARCGFSHLAALGRRRQPTCGRQARQHESKRKCAFQPHDPLFLPARSATHPPPLFQPSCRTPVLRKVRAARVPRRPAEYTPPGPPLPSVSRQTANAKH